MTLELIQFLAKFGSEARDGMSLFAAPMVIPMLVLARAFIMFGSDPYNLTFSMVVDWRSFAVADGGGRLSATSP